VTIDIFTHFVSQVDSLAKCVHVCQIERKVLYSCHKYLQKYLIDRQRVAPKRYLASVAHNIVINDSLTLSFSDVTSK